MIMGLVTAQSYTDGKLDLAVCSGRTSPPMSAVEPCLPLGTDDQLAAIMLR
jgi:hypothetical protein